MMTPPLRPPRKRSAAFTLVEVLVVIAIVIALAALVFGLSGRSTLAAEKAKCQALIREFEVPLAAFQMDRQRPLLPEHKEDEDTIFGDYNGFYSTAPLVAVLTGAEEMLFEETTGEAFDLSSLNPSRTEYLDPSIVIYQDGGIREDGKIYDPWDRELIFAINSAERRTDFNNGRRDDILYTYTLGEYSDTKPRYQEFVIWSYGKDLLIGDEGKTNSNGLPRFSGSDDVKSW